MFHEAKSTSDVDINLKILTDEQVLLVQNGTVTLIGTGPEVVL